MLATQKESQSMVVQDDDEMKYDFNIENSSDDNCDDEKNSESDTEKPCHPVSSTVLLDFTPPSVDSVKVTAGDTYTFFSPVPQEISDNIDIECIAGIDEAGRGPVLGPMVYATFYISQSQHACLRKTYGFTDSKAMSKALRTKLIQEICCSEMSLYKKAGYAVHVLSAQNISAHMLPPVNQPAYSLNAQAMDATVALIQGLLDRNLNLQTIYVDTLGKPQAHKKRLSERFPMLTFIVEKKADATYPVVGAASVVAKVTRDASLELLRRHVEQNGRVNLDQSNWGSGYPSDPKTINWLKSSQHSLFGWGSECRFSWGTIRDILESSNASKTENITKENPSDSIRSVNSILVEWPETSGSDTRKNQKQLGHFFKSSSKEKSKLPVKTNTTMTITTKAQYGQIRRWLGNQPCKEF